MSLDIRPNQSIITFFFLKNAMIRQGRNAGNYLHLDLCDRKGEIRGFVWHEPEVVLARLRDNSFVQVVATSRQVGETVVLHIDKIRTAYNEEIDISDYFDTARQSTEDLLVRLYGIVDKITDLYLKKLIQSFLNDQDFLEKFVIAPAGKKIHHNYSGGLLEHTVDMMATAVSLSERYGRLNRDLLITGAFLHDLGKIEELQPGIQVAYTTEGKLLGHIAIGLEMIQKKISLIPGFPEALEIMLKHMLISHHGKHDFGSPVKPATPEAVALHMLDNFDARLNHIDLISTNSNQEDEWTRYDKILGTEIYQKPYISVCSDKKADEIPCDDDSIQAQCPDEDTDSAEETSVFEDDEIYRLILDEDDDGHGTIW